MFEGCDELKEIPRGLRYLISLRTLTLTTKQKRLPENVIGCLNSLQTLEISKCENLEYLCDDIDRLKALRTLLITGCPSLLSLPCNIKYSSSLENLILMKCEKLNLRIEMEDDDSHQDLNNTQIQLRTLSILALPNLEELPQWLLHANTLESLAINECPNFRALSESLQHLESLKFLYISSCPKFTSLPKDMDRLIALRDLRIFDSPVLIERCKKDTGEDWLKIAHIPLIWLDDEEIKSRQSCFEGRESRLAAVIALPSSLDYTTSKSTLKLLLPLADPAQALNVPVRALLSAAYPLSSSPPYIFSWLNNLISAEDMMHP
ncbi:hypothetical protein JRO89_XS05G0254700 [Xanthoceras sorbifolium]|uniref:Uncharacterized protein n=1 Tax=Xanthoceras sorbifolium TaxID=99658 RepID=A0ABQ8I3D0_9ROSI|nr:hypothetical protein JRO89_XS05G0254700 [Xanthoceras sorbifolium]